MCINQKLVGFCQLWCLWRWSSLLLLEEGVDFQDKSFSFALSAAFYAWKFHFKDQLHNFLIQTVFWIGNLQVNFCWSNPASGLKQCWLCSSRRTTCICSFCHFQSQDTDAKKTPIKIHLVTPSKYWTVAWTANGSKSTNK